MSAFMNQRDFLINMMCVEKGIVPVSGMNIEHIAATLENMEEVQRRLVTRKFRKILKKAIRYEASTWYPMGTSGYHRRVSQLKRNTGLINGRRGPNASRLTGQQRALRHTIVQSYLGKLSHANS